MIIGIIFIAIAILLLLKSFKNDALCKTTLREIKKKYQAAFSNSLIVFVSLVGATVWTYFNTSGISCFLLMFVLVIFDFILFFVLLSNFVNWSKYKDMTEKQFLELQMKAKKENEEIAKQSQEINKGLRAYNTGYKIGQFLGGL